MSEFGLIPAKARVYMTNLGHGLLRRHYYLVTAPGKRTTTNLLLTYVYLEFRRNL